MQEDNINAYLVHHINDIAWIKKNTSNNIQLIGHEDYMQLLSDESIELFFEYNHDFSGVDDEINHFLQHWHRDELGKDSSLISGISIGQILTVGLALSINSIYREYHALKFWLKKYDKIYISSNEVLTFKNIAKEFDGRVIEYDPEHQNNSALVSMNNRELVVPKIHPVSSFLRIIQKPFRKFVKNKNLYLKDWTYKYRVKKDKKSLMVDSLSLFNGAYLKKPSIERLKEFQALFPEKLNLSNIASNFHSVLMRKGFIWDEELLRIISNYIQDRYKTYRDFYISTSLLYNDLLLTYEPKNIVIPGEVYEPYNIVAQIARKMNIDVTLLVDGYPLLTGIPYLLDNNGKQLLCNRLVPLGAQNHIRFTSYSLNTTLLDAVYPPLLDYHRKINTYTKEFDVIVLTYHTPRLNNPDQRLGSTPLIVLDILRDCEESGFKKIAIKLKNNIEKRWLVPILDSQGWMSKVVFLEGMLYKHVNKAKKIVGPISSAVGETIYHNIPYYIYEPKVNGYTDERLRSSRVFTMNSIARNVTELVDILKKPSGSITVDKKHMLNGSYEINLDKIN